MSDRLTLEQLRETDEFKNLTEKQRFFVETYVAGGLDNGHYDPITATRNAYPACKNEEVARVMSYSLLQTPKIVAVLNMHFARTPNEAFLVTLDRAIRNKRLSIAQFKAMELKARLMGFKSHQPDAHHGSVHVIPEEVIARDKAERKKRRKPGRPKKFDTPEPLPVETPRFSRPKHV